MCTNVIVDPDGIELETIRQVANFLGISPEEVDPSGETWHFGDKAHNVLPISSYDFCLCGVDTESVFEAHGFNYICDPERDAFNDHAVRRG